MIGNTASKYTQSKLWFKNYALEKVVGPSPFSPA